MNLHVLFLALFLSRLLTVVLQRRHLLLVLLRLERAILILVLVLMTTFARQAVNDVYLFIIVLSFGAMEARLGLALLVAMSRKSGSDLVSSMIIRKC